MTVEQKKTVMCIISIRCKYAYNSGLNGETFEHPTETISEEWEITFGYYKKEPLIILHNLDQNFRESIGLKSEQYEKIVLGKEQDMTKYLQTAYELHLERSRK